MPFYHLNNGNCCHNTAYHCEDCAKILPRVRGIDCDAVLCDICHTHGQDRGECQECLPCTGCSMEDLFLEMQAGYA